MSVEGQLYEKKSLRVLTKEKVDWWELAKDFVAFANASGGRLIFGIEDEEELPPPNQVVLASQLDLIRKRISERTSNVSVEPSIVTASNGGQYIEVYVERSVSVASTTDGRYYVRVADQSRPLIGDEIFRLMTERTMLSWESQRTLTVRRSCIDKARLRILFSTLRSSDRVKASVKEKSDDELMDHYRLSDGEYLTNLGVMFIGTQSERSKLSSAPVVQVIRYDENGRKVRKQVWDEHLLSPNEIIEAVWKEVPEFHEHFEISDGLFRNQVPAFDEVVVREVLVNAVVHRPYTQRGDIFLNLYPDRLEVVNPGLLPLGVTPHNILHTTVRRNDHMARLFHDLKLMEKEGSGFDKMYEILLEQGRKVPQLREGNDRVEVTIFRSIISPEVIDFIAKAESKFELSQREKIALGILAQSQALSASEWAQKLELPTVDDLAKWNRTLLQTNLVRSVGKKKGTRYFVDPELLRSLHFDRETTLQLIEPHRLTALVELDLKLYPDSSVSEINHRIGSEVRVAYIRKSLKELIELGVAEFEGEKRWRRYRLKR